jgi:hypothetical protein
VDASALNTFVPLVSAAIGAGATYLWQTLGNRRTDIAVRMQTNARLLELISFLCEVYFSEVLGKEETATLQRIVSTLDDMQIAVAFRKNPDVLWRLGEIRIGCERLMARASQSVAGPASSKLLPEAYITSAYQVIVFAMSAFTEQRLRNVAEANLRVYDINVADAAYVKRVKRIPRP